MDIQQITLTTGSPIIVEVEGYEGDNGDILVNGSDTAMLYCIGMIESDGVLRFVDWGYESAAIARRAWPDAVEV